MLGSNRRESGPYGPGSAPGSLPRGSQPPRVGGPMTLLAGPKGRTRVAPLGGTKLAVPKPVNLPSIKKEHSGNDPSTQLVPPAVAGGWNREPGSDTSTAATASAPAASHNAAALSAVSTWASPHGGEVSTPSAPSGYAAHSGSNSHTGGSGWQQPQPGVRLNPNEYPSLSAAAAAAAQAAHHEAAVASGGSGQPVSKPAGALPARPAFPSGTSWADDDRDTSGLGPVHLFGAGARGGTQRHQGEADSTPPEADLLPPPRGHAAPAPSGDWRASGAGGSALLMMPPPAAVHVAATAVHQQQQQQQQHTQGGQQPAAQPSQAQPQSAASAAASWRKAPSSEGGARHPAGPPAPPVAPPQPQFTAERPPLVLSRANVGAMSPAVRASAAAVLAATSSQVGSGHGGETPHAAVSAEQAPHSSSGAPPAPSPLSDVVVMKRVLPLSDGHSGEVRHERRQAPAPAQQQQPAQVKPRPVASTEEAAPPQPAWAPSAAGVAAAPSAAQSSKSGPQPQQQQQRPGAHVTVLHRPPGSSLPVPPPALPALGSHEIGTLPVAVPLSAVGSHGLAAPQTLVGDDITGGAATGGASGGSGESRRKRGGRRVREADERRASKADHGSLSPTRQVQAPPPPQPQQAQPQSGRGGQQKGGKGAPKEVPKPHGAAADVAAAHGGRNGGATRKERGAAGGHLPGHQQAQQPSDHLRGSLHSQSTPHGGGAPPHMLIVTQHGMGGSLMSVGPGGVGSLAPNVHSHNGQHSLSAAGGSAGIQAAGFMLAGSGGAFGGPGAPGGGGGGGQQWRGHSAGGPTPTGGSLLWGLSPAGGPAGPTNNAAQQQQQQHSRGQQALGQQQPQPRGHHHAHGQQHSQQAQQQLQQQRGAGVMALGGGAQLGSSFGGSGIPTQGALFGNGGAGQGGSSSGSTMFAAPGGNPFARPFVSTGPGQDASAGGPASSAATSSFGVGGLFVGGSMWAHTPQQLGAPPGGVQGAQVGGGGALFRRGSGASSDQLDAAPGAGGMASTVWYGAPQQGATGNGWF